MTLLELTARNLRLTVGGLLLIRGSNLTMRSFQVSDCRMGNQSNATTLRVLEEASTNASTATAAEQAPQSVAIFETSNLTLADSSFTDNGCVGDLCSGGALQMKQCSAALENMIFQRNSARKGGALSIINPVNENRILNSQFEQNAAGYMGGAISINSSLDAPFSFLFRDIKVKNNTSEYLGGGLFIQNLENPSSLQAVAITDSNFQLNRALAIGGIYATGTVLQLERNFVYNNFADLYGNDIFAYPTRFKLFHDNSIQHNAEETEFTILEQKSGGVLPYMMLQPIDDQLQTLRSAPIYDSDLQLRVSISPSSPNYDNTYLRGEYKFDYTITDSLGLTYTITDLQIIGIPGGEPAILQLESNVIRKIENQLVTNTYKMNFTVQFRDCGVGEIYL